MSKPASSQSASRSKEKPTAKKDSVQKKDQTKDRSTDSTPVLLQPDDSQWYISRELSWLEFNRRVLHEAVDKRTPLLERLKFLAIFSSNLDEYFMVRVAATKQQIEANVYKRTPDGRTPSEQLEAIGQRLRPMIDQVHSYFQNVLRGELIANDIRLLNYEELSAEQTDYLDQYFKDQIFPVLTPLAVDPGHPFPYISNLSINLAVEIQDQASAESHFARVKVPKVLPRFVQLPTSLEGVQPCRWTGVPMEQIISHNIAALFPGMSVKDCYTFRITRNADLSVEEDEADDLMLAIEQELRKRRLGGSVVRMEIEKGMKGTMRATLLDQLSLSEKDVYDVEGLLGLTDLMSFMGLPISELKDVRWKPVTPAPWKLAAQQEGEDVFSLIKRRDRLVHHPYQAFSGTVQTFITQAATDPDVLAIKMTLYRTSGDSPIVNALIKAAENDKQVVALVELKARFDEENNINWARALERAGVHVVYGLIGLKTHTKVALVVRRETDVIRRYVHIGTGNYNPKTAKLYTDLGLLSCREDLGKDLTDLFNYLTGYSRQQSYKKLLIAPVDLRSRMTQFIQQETKHAKEGKRGHIIAKMNALVDADIITELYKASQAGVKIELIIRGICCLRPGIKGLSDNINVVSIIGRFLEHSRIFYFHNDDDELFYIGSADWMPRNLDRRVEALVPIEDPPLRSELAAILETCLQDNRQAWKMKSDGTYVQLQPQKGEAEVSTHSILMEKALSQS
ncbi:polyphosphate kinase [Synechococcus sp. PCC 7335]|uniref:polyphosphate kinase 1 n=1 Tax=Synechococcus sp. (strain ATCC 29403 / PCC 7335) TaxID=91464 RepID=UPI00017EB189|nr:polyphosphate kinase 1 [Synechococcus sp. PCC 7335]EDX87223.1 polyphosphate kinase [Synechococcus sp. PCC 7335]